MDSFQWKEAFERETELMEQEAQAQARREREAETNNMEARILACECLDDLKNAMVDILREMGGE